MYGDTTIPALLHSSPLRLHYTNTDVPISNWQPSSITSPLSREERDALYVTVAAAENIGSRCCPYIHIPAHTAAAYRLRLWKVRAGALKVRDQRTRPPVDLTLEGQRVTWRKRQL